MGLLSRCGILQMIGAQLDAIELTFIALDDNRLCRWDMRDMHGIVQQTDSTVLNWVDGHQFARGKKLQCFTTTRDECVVIGSSDGKIRLFGKTSMRVEKTTFSGLGSSITHVDANYDGKWNIGITGTYLILISIFFTDKDEKKKEKDRILWVDGAQNSSSEIAQAYSSGCTFGWKE